MSKRQPSLRELISLRTGRISEELAEATVTGINLVFPWPDRELSPNARKNFRQKAKSVSISRQYARFLTLSGQPQLVFSPSARLETTLTFYPPDNRKRDIDNLLASMKSSLDGIFDALEMNDNCVRRTVLEWGDTIAGGRVTIEIQEVK